jgi:hypothetical protein
MTAGQIAQSLRPVPIERVNILETRVFQYKWGIVGIQAQPRADVADSRIIRQVQNLLNYPVSDSNSQHGWVIQPA